MSIYKHPYTGAFQFVFAEVSTYENIVLNWLYDKFVISYKNDIFDITIKSALKHFLHTTLLFGQVVFEKLIWDVTQIKKIKRRFGMVKIIRDYFLNKENEILIYRPTNAELIIKINEINQEKKEPNKKCCVCLENKFISDAPIFNCSHTELCWGCYLKMGTNKCPLCRSDISTAVPESQNHP
jgi:hypothetical protein